jgi:hypothetical protein
MIFRYEIPQTGRVGHVRSLRANLPRLRAGRRARLEKRVKRKLRAALLVGRPSLTFTTEHHEERRPPRFVCDQIVGSRVAFAELAVARWWDKADRPQPEEDLQEGSCYSK